MNGSNENTSNEINLKHLLKVRKFNIETIKRRINLIIDYRQT